jgi:hypothetical protein
MKKIGLENLTHHKARMFLVISQEDSLARKIIGKHENVWIYHNKVNGVSGAITRSRGVVVTPAEELEKLMEEKRIQNKQERENTPLCIYIQGWSSSFNKCPNIRTLFMNGRHYNITVVVHIESWTDIDLMIRCQLDYVFTSFPNNLYEMRRLYFDYFGNFKEFKSFQKCLFQSLLANSYLGSDPYDSNNIFLFEK